jgi:hypothetical protein
MVLVSFVSYGQTKKLDTLYVNRCNDIEWTKDYGVSDLFKTIKFEDGSSLNQGDIIKIGYPSGTNMTKQVNTGLVSSNVHNSNNFSYLILGRIGLNALMGIQYIPEEYKGKNARLIEIKMGHNGFTRKSSTNVVLIFEVERLGMVMSVWDIKSAFGNNELINPNRPMNRTEAIAKLKETKDLLDLGMISKDEFDKMKDKLSPIISQNK